MTSTETQNEALEARSILVGIPALNEVAHIADCIRSVLRGAPELEDVKIVVADGGSRDGTRAEVERLQQELPNLHLISNPEKLQAAAMNRIAQETTEPHHRVMVRVDAHSIYPDNYVLDVARQLVERQVAGLATTMDATGGNCFQRASAWIVDTKLGSGGSGHRGGAKSGYVNHGHHAGMDLEWYRKIGGYDVAFSHNEDAEFDHRLTEAGGKIWLAADIRLKYDMRPTPKALWRQYWNYGRGRAQNIKKHRMRPQLRQMIPVLHVILLLLSLLVLPLTGLGWIWPMLYVALLVGASFYIAFSKKSACGLWAGPALGIMHTSWGLGFLSKTFGLS